MGVDVVDLRRFASVLDRAPRIVERLFTDREREYCEGRKRAERYAGRFAAKEAALKALGCGLGACRWHDLEVVRSDVGSPTLVATGRAARLCAERGVRALHVSISHDGHTAVATVVAE